MTTAHLWFGRSQVYYRSCDYCVRYAHEDSGPEMGEVIRLGGLADGEPFPRPKGTAPPCHKCPKQPWGTTKPSPETAIDPTPRSKAALHHYRRCRAVGRFPVDPIVERNAVIIGDAERDVADNQVSGISLMIAALASAAGGGR